MRAWQKLTELYLSVDRRVLGLFRVGYGLVLLCDLARRGIQRATLMPLYPQFADSTVTTVLEEVRRIVQDHHLRLQLDVIPPFHDRPEYLSALVASMRPYVAQPHDHLLLSYHGLPERHIRKADPTGRHCLCSPACCQQVPATVLDRCYRAQCVRTSERLTATLAARAFILSWTDPTPAPAPLHLDLASNRDGV